MPCTKCQSAEPVADTLNVEQRSEKAAAIRRWMAEVALREEQYHVQEEGAKGSSGEADPGDCGDAEPRGAGDPELDSAPSSDIGENITPSSSSTNRTSSNKLNRDDVFKTNPESSTTPLFAQFVPATCELEQEK